MKKALVYINLGTPNSPEAKDVAPYLREFLMDPFVLDIPKFLRWPLVHGVIVPRRAKKSAEAYKQIWRAEGSPLRINTQNLVTKVRKQMQNEMRVELAMRYGAPSIATKIQELVSEGVEEFAFLPAYPQYAQSSTETAFFEARKAIALHKKTGVKISAQFIKSYEDHPGFVASVAEQITQAAQNFKPDYYLFSYHGLPISHVKNISSTCDGVGDCSLQQTEQNKYCYRRQCYSTTGAIVRHLRLDRNQFTVGFQSRLTKGWIQPFTDEIYKALPQKGVRKLLVACPSFTADCLETLEEIGIRAREEFRAHGGDDLKLVPCVNSEDSWVNTVVAMVREKRLWQSL